MNRTLDLLFKIFVLPWFGFVLIMITMLSGELMTTSSYDNESHIAFAISIFCAVAAFRFTRKSWNFLIKSEPTELILDDLDALSPQPNHPKFSDYKASCFLAILVGLISLVFGIMAFSSTSDVEITSMEDVLIAFSYAVLVIFGVLIIHRAVYIWRKISKEITNETL